MDREYLATLLLLATAAPALWTWPSRQEIVAPSQPARAVEARCWRAIWVSASPLVFTVALVVGWWIAVPDDAPLPPKTIVGVSLVFAVVCGRAIWRATRSWWASRSINTVGTTGFWRPRIVMSKTVRRRLDAPARRAALAHEAAHVRHRDPLRIWIIQLVTDLQWPWPWARQRFTAWRAALEMARDEEARLRGIAGADLAAAILRVARAELRPSAHALLAGDAEEVLKERVARLLAPIPIAGGTPLVPTFSRFGFPMMLAGGTICGLLFGAAVVRAALQLLP